MTESVDRPKLTLEERLEIQEVLMGALLYAAFADEPLIRRKMAESLNTDIQVCQQHQSRPDPVLAELRLYADSLVGLDSLPEPLRTHLRP